MNLDTQFAFQRLDCYRCAIEFVALALRFTTKFPRGQGKLVDQFRRAALSIPLNIAEAAGRAGRPEAAYHSTIARGSSMECASILDVCREMGFLPPGDIDRAQALLVRIVQMLFRMYRDDTGPAR